MVMEADHRGRVPAAHHPGQQQLGGPPTPQQQQNWVYQQQRQAALGGLPPMMMQPGAPFPGAYPMAMPGMPFQPMLYMGGPPPAPAHLMSMPPRPPPNPWAMGQPFLQQPPPHHMPQGSMQQAPRRMPRSAVPANPQPQHMRPGTIVVPAGVVVRGPTAVTAAGPARAGALSMQPLPAAMAALVAAAATAPGNNPAASKSAARAVLVQPLNAQATAQQAQAAAGVGVKHFKKLETLAAEAQCQMDYGSDDESEYGDCAMSCETPRFDGGSGWAWLVDGVLQQVIACIQASNTSLSAFRATCTNWRACADATMETLAPKALLPRDLIRLFPKLQALQLVSCRNVRNRDLFVLANNELHLTSLVLGDDTNKPWVTNRGIESIAKMTNLRVLALHDCNSITNKGVTFMQALTGLHSLSLRGCRKLTNNGMLTIAKLPHVTRLNLYGCKRLSCAGMQELINLPLKALALGHTRIRCEGLKHIALLTQLTELHLVKEEVKLEGLLHLHALSELRVLALRDMSLKNATVSQLLLNTPDKAGMTHLKDLSLFRNTDVTQALLSGAVLDKLHGLTALDLRETNVEDVGVAALTCLVNLRCLKLKPPPYGVSAGGLNPQHAVSAVTNYPSVSQLKQLDSLTVAMPVLCTEQMGGIAVLTGLQELDLGRGPLAAALEEAVLKPFVYADIGRLTRLTSLDLSRRRMVDRQEVEDRKKACRKGKYPTELRVMMSKLQRLCSINLGSTAIEPDAIKRLVRHFPAVNIDGRKSMSETTPDLANYGLAGTLCVL